MSRSRGTHVPKRNAYRFIVADPERKRKLQMPKRICEDNIKVDIQEMG